MPGRTVVMVLPSFGHDPTEAAGTWYVLNKTSIQIVFATPDGQPAVPDPLMVSGEGLDLWGCDLSPVSRTTS